MSFQYALSRDRNASMRLYFQNWMWRYQTGYLLHPDIPVDKKNLRVADIGCGTGIWLIELARSLPASAQLDGYDISADQFPPREWCPKNVNLQTLDAFGTIPENLLGTYDAVHVGTLFFIIRNEDPSPLLANILLLLKPGGYLQWDESDLESMQMTSVDHSFSHPAWDKHQAELKSWFAARGVTFKWVSEMDKHFTRSAFKVVSYNRLPISNDIANPYTDNILSAIEDLHKNAFLPSCTESASPSAQEWFDMFQAVVHECQPSTSIRMDMMIAVGRKKVSAATEGPALCASERDFPAAKMDLAPGCQAGAAQRIEPGPESGKDGTRQESRPRNAFISAMLSLRFLRCLL